MTSRVWNWSAAAALGMLSLIVAFMMSAPPAKAYSASQAEAQTDPSNDPYNFPNIQVCCRPHYPRPPCDDDDRQCREHHGHHHSHHEHGYDSVDVDCGASPRNRHVATTLQEAVEAVEPGGVIRVHSAFPGSGCVGNVLITKSLTIQGVGAFGGDDDGHYGGSGNDAYRGAAPGGRNPITAVVDGCISIWGPGRPRVALRDIEILGTTTGYVKDCNPVPAMNEGSSGLTPPRTRTGENLFTALMVDGGTLIGTNVSVRSAGRAFFAEHSVVEFTGGNLAAHPAYDAADAAVWLLRTQATLRGVSIAGGRDGVIISMLDRYPVTFTDVAILPVRTQVGGVYPSDGRLYRGKTGVRIKVDYEDLPSTADHDVARFTWTGGTVHGYRQGIDVGPGVNGSITGVSIVDTMRAAHFARGAQIAFDGNRVTGNHDVAIQIDPGAVGSASSNQISCAHGACICYGGDCDDRDVEASGFVLRGNVCRREDGRGREYEDVGGSDW